MKVVCFEQVCYEWVCYERGLLWTGLFWMGTFVYRDHGRGHHTDTFNLFQIPEKWLKFFRFKSNPKIKLQNIMQTRKPILV